MAFCLMPQQVERFKRALKKKEIKIGDIMNMETSERINLLKEYAGDNASDINKLFEEKLVLKNRVQGIKNWVEKISESGRYSKTKIADLKLRASEYKALQQERIFSPKEHESFLNALADEEMGVAVTREEAKQLFDLSSKANKFRADFDEVTSTWKNLESQKNYGATKVALEKYTEMLKDPNLTIPEQVKGRMKEFLVALKENKSKAVKDLLLDVAAQIANNSVAMVATLDNSFMGRQGLKVLMTHPKQWAYGAKNSFIDFAKTLKGEEPLDALMAEVYSSPNFLNGKYEKAKILDLREEQFPTTLPERMPVVGRVVKASETAFKGSALRMRTALFDSLINSAASLGHVMDDAQVKSVGKLVNSLTAKGDLGKLGQGGIIKLVMWAPKMLKANIDVLTAHAGQEMTAFARKEALKNLAKIVGTTGTILTVANALRPGSVEWDPRSSDFGKIIVGDTRFDITGGMSQILVLMSRMVMGGEKSTKTGEITEYSGEYGQKTRFDALLNFFSNKANPAAKVVINMLKGSNFAGEKPTVASELYSSFTPISLQNAIKLKDERSAPAIIGVLTDLVGISSNTYAGMTEAERLKFQQKKKKAEVKEKVTNVYDEIQAVKATDPAKAQELLDALSDEEYAAYKSIRSTRKSAETKQKTESMYDTVIQVQELKDSGSLEEAQSIVDGMTDEEYEYYQKAKEQLYGG